MRRTSLATIVAATAIVAGGCQQAQQQLAPVSPVERGKYLVTSMGCNDCHTPWKLGEKGPEPDMSRLLSGHPEGMQLPPSPALPPGPWGITAALSMTAWSGPWGVSYTANLTPDPETGLGALSEQNFIQALRTGKHLGAGRDILPPMPWPAYQNLSDEDLKSIFAYLKSIPPIRNKVPDPVPPVPAGK
jgi:cytochrome c553